MIYLGTGELIKVTVVLMTLSVMLWPSKSSEYKGERLKIRKSLSRLLIILSAAAVIATIIIIQFEGAQDNKFLGYNIRELNEIIEVMNERLEKIWIVRLGILLTLALATICGWIEINIKRSQKIQSLNKLISAGNLLVGVLATASFVGAGYATKVEGDRTRALSVRENLQEVRVALFQRVMEVAQQYSAAELVSIVEEVNPQVKGIRNALNLVAPYLPKPRNHTNALLAVSLVNARHYSLKPEIDAAVIPTIIPDISTDEARLYKANFNGAVPEMDGKDALINDIVTLVYERTISFEITNKLLSIENPIISEIVTTIIDPVIGEPLVNSISRIVTETIAKKWGPDRLRSSIKSEVNSLSHKMKSMMTKRKMEKRTYDARMSIGETMWHEVRKKLERWILFDIKSIAPSLTANAREEFSKFKKMWDGVDILLVNPKLRERIGEEIFANYLLANPILSAYWGYGVITFVSNKNKLVIENWLVNDMVNSAGGKERIKWVRDAIENKSSYEDLQFKFYGNTYGQNDLTVGDITIIEEVAKWFVDSQRRNITDLEIVKKYISSRGAFPEDGLYLYLIDNVPEDSRKYYKRIAYSEEILKTIDSYLYHQSLNNGKKFEGFLMRPEPVFRYLQKRRIEPIGIINNGREIKDHPIKIKHPSKIHRK